VLLPNDRTIEAFAAVAEQLPAPERLKLLASVLKYPTVYGDARDALIKPIKKHLRPTPLSRLEISGPLSSGSRRNPASISLGHRSGWNARAGENRKIAGSRDGAASRWTELALCRCHR